MTLNIGDLTPEQRFHLARLALLMGVSEQEVLDRLPEITEAFESFRAKMMMLAEAIVDAYSNVDAEIIAKFNDALENAESIRDREPHRFPNQRSSQFLLINKGHTRPRI